MYKIKNILVLGSAGQIGSALTLHLKNKGYNVIEFDIENDKNQDLRIPNVLSNLITRVDFVVFLAFDVGGSIYLNKYQNSFDFISNNMKIMANTFETLKIYKTPFIFASSQMTNLINSSYGILKNIGEQYTKTLKNGKIAKFWNVYGHEKNLEKSHVITDFILMAKNNNHIKIKTSGKEKRQFLYSEDCSECLTILMEKFENIQGKSFDVSNFSWHSINEVAIEVASNFTGCKISSGKYIDDLQREKLPDPTTEILEYWQPKTLLSNGIKKIIKHYDVNQRKSIYKDGSLLSR